MLRIVCRMIVCPSFLLLSSCATTPLLEEQPLEQSLPLVNQPDWSVGHRQITVDNQTGEENSWEILSIDENGLITGRSNNGCEWSVSREWFAGVERWKNCGGSDGTRTLLKSEGTLWPLKVGNRSSYTYQLTSENGDNRQERIKCQVASEGNVTVAQGELDVFRVQCVRTNEWSIETRTWYWSPESGEVKFLHHDNNKGLQRDVDVIRSENS